MQDPKRRLRNHARITAGIPESNSALYWRIRFCVGDPVALVELRGDGGMESTLILRDIEMGRARRIARVDRVACPADFTPPGGLSGDRETATAQAAAECLRRAGVTAAVADRSLPLLFADRIQSVGIGIECDPEMWVLERRRKTGTEIDHIRAAPRVTEEAVQRACELVARAEAGAGGVLLHRGEPLTSERVRAAVDHFLVDRGFINLTSIIAGGPKGADCHDHGSGELRTGEPVIVDIFPRSRATRYCGDCTRTVVHGDVPEELQRMHAAVCRAKAAAIRKVAPGVTGGEIHAATTGAITDAGYAVGLPVADSPRSYCSITHGTGHGVGLDVHEPPLLDAGGPALLTDDVVTVEPGLYRRDLGGVRVEDIVVVTEAGCENLNGLPEGLDWR
jgi:Xaa-Pro aminopeptidase